jgi:hypothetical protein
MGCQFSLLRSPKEACEKILPNCLNGEVDTDHYSAGISTGRKAVRREDYIKQLIVLNKKYFKS